jgi:hypothetical protein
LRSEAISLVAPVDALLVEAVLGVPDVDTDSTTPLELVTVVVTVPLALATTVVVVLLLDPPPPPPPPPLLVAPPEALVPPVDEVVDAALVADVDAAEDVDEVDVVDDADDVDAVDDADDGVAAVVDVVFVGLTGAATPLIALMFIDASIA